MSHTQYSGVDILEALLEAKKYNDFLINEVVKGAKGCRSAVDFGAGIGTFVVALREKGFEISCVEPDGSLYLKLKDSGFNVFHNLNEAPEGSAEYIYSLNVLEHIEDDKAIVRSIHQCLKQGGRFLLYVPAFNILYSSMDKKVGHLRRYKKKDVCSLLIDAGFEIESAEYVDSIGFFLSLLYKFIGNKNGDLNLATIKIFDTFIFPASRTLDKVFKYFFGKNVLVLAKRI